MFQQLLRRFWMRLVEHVDGPLMMITWMLMIAGLLTERTPTPADDAVLAFLERSIGNPALFDPIYDLLTALLAGAGESQKAGLTPALAGEAEKAGIDPLTILAIVDAVASLIKLIRERRGAK